MDPPVSKSKSSAAPPKEQANRGRRRKLNDFNFANTGPLPTHLNRQDPKTQQYNQHMALWLANDVQPSAPEEGDTENPFNDTPSLSQSSVDVAPDSSIGGKQISKYGMIPAARSYARFPRGNLFSPESDVSMKESDTANADSAVTPTPELHKDPMLRFGGSKLDTTTPGRGALNSILSPPPTPITLRQANTTINNGLANTLSLPPRDPNVSANRARDAGTATPGVISAPRGMLRRKRAAMELTTESLVAIDSYPPAKRGKRSNDTSKAAMLKAKGGLTDGVKSKVWFLMLPLEIRDKIYYELLKSDDSIRVMKHWTQRYMRCRPGVHPAILQVCKQVHAEASRVLYGKNTFQYLLRDTSDASPMPWGTPERARRARPVRKSDDNSRYIDVRRYGHLMRKLELVVEANRTGAEYKACMEKALMALSAADGGFNASLESITFTVWPRFEADTRLVTTTVGEMAVAYGGRYLSAVDFFSRGGQVVKMLEKISVNYVRINVHIGGVSKYGLNEGDDDYGGDDDDFEDADDDADDEDWHGGGDSGINASQPIEGEDVPEDGLEVSGPRHLETSIDLRYLPNRIEARKVASGSLWLEDHLTVAARERRGEYAQKALKGLRLRVQKAVLQPTKAIAGGLWEDHDAAEVRRQEQRIKAQMMLLGDDSPRDTKHGEVGDDDQMTGVRESLIVKFTCHNTIWSARVI